MPSLQPFMDLITIGEKRNVHIDLANMNYPSLIFSFVIDSKVDIQLEIEEILSHAYMGSVYMGTIRRNWLDNEFEKFDALPKLGRIWMNLPFTPPKDFLKSPSPNQWDLKGAIAFSAENYIRAPKKFELRFKIGEEEIKSALQFYFQL